MRPATEGIRGLLEVAGDLRDRELQIEGPLDLELRMLSAKLETYVGLAKEELDAIEKRSSPSLALDEFHSALGDRPGQGGAQFRMRLLREEFNELMDELLAEAVREGWTGASQIVTNRWELAHEMADLVFVLYGTARAFDIDLDSAVEEMRRAMMSRLVRPNGEPPIVVDGKPKKPPEYVEPDMTGAVRGWFA